MRREDRMVFRCPACGGVTLTALLESRPRVVNLTVYGPGGRPKRDVALRQGDTDKDGYFVGYDEEGADEVETKKYICSDCGREFDTIVDVLDCCVAANGDQAGIGVPGKKPNLTPSEMADLMSCKMYTPEKRSRVLCTIQAVCAGTIFDSKADAARALGIKEAEVDDEDCCLVLKSTGRVFIK